MKQRLAVVALALLTGGCLMGPDYTRPEIPAVPAEFRAAGTQAPSAASLADVKWFELFQDEALQDLIRTALQQNYDLRVAVARVLQARAQLGITRADLFPQLDGNAAFEALRQAENGRIRLPTTTNPRTGRVELVPGTTRELNFYQGGVTLSWELDLWGKFRRLTEAARAELLGSEETRRAVTISLVSEVAQAYFELRALDLELQIAQSTRQARERGLRLTTIRRDRGVASALDIRQAENLLYTALATIADLNRQIEQKENQLSLLLAQNPGEIPRGRFLVEQSIPPEIPPGLPSALLDRRPDIRAAEQSLVAANARIGAAKALYFPQISLTGLLGVESRALGDLVRKGAWVWNAGASAAVPIFNAGRISSQVDLAEALRGEALVQYEQTIRTAFREVADALVGYRQTREQYQQQALLVAALRDASRLSLLRYQGGLDSYLQVLDADSRLFDAELRLAQLRRDELIAVVQLYKALGGGWEP